ncbi:MAG: AraC family transcriptional regulator [Bacteroidia bacterium]|nr:AraC family transcriptional regulator [Bacteroidia bacterium]
MKLENIRLLQEPGKSFIVYHETNPFSPWHHHPEFELVLITKGKGKRMVGDHIDRFDENDLVLVGSFLPHEWLCDREFFDHPEGFQGEGIVYQFLQDFLGTHFFEVPENKNLRRLLDESSRGLKFHGKTKARIISLMLSNYKLDGTNRLYSLFSIFKILNRTREYTLLSSPGFMEPFHLEGNEQMQKALEYLLQNFHRGVSMKEMIRVTNMSNTAFSMAFKKSYRMTFKEYLLNIRIGYACKLLTDASLNISQIAYNCGFENISNFNRQFKKLKGTTPSQFLHQANSDQSNSGISV